MSERRLVFEMTAAGLPWHLNPSSAGSGVVAGTICHMQIRMAGTQCTAVIDGMGAHARDGYGRFRYSGATGHLTVLTNRSGLHFFDVRGCFGLIHDGDPATIGATFVVSPEQAITSPRAWVPRSARDSGSPDPRFRGARPGHHGAA